jgi:type IV secretion/conjugal transfer VirB4 family ATPase
MELATSLHSAEYGISDLIQASALVEDGVLELKDGGFLAAWCYDAPDYDFQDPMAAYEARDGIGRELGLGTGWVLETNVIRRHLPSYPAWGTFPDPVSRLIDEERRQNYTATGRYFTSRYYLSLSYFPPNAHTEKAKGWFYESPDDAEDVGLAEKSLRYFAEVVDRFQSMLSRYLMMTRLRRQTYRDPDGEEHVGDELLRYVRLCTTGEDRPFILPDSDPIDLDALIPTKGLVPGSEPAFDDGTLLRVLALDPLPRLLFPCSLRILEDLPCEFRLHTRAIFVDRPAAATLHENNRKRHKARETGFLTKLRGKGQMPIGAVINQNAVKLTRDAEDALSLTDSAQESWGMFSARVILMRDNAESIKEDVKMIAEALQPCHIGCRRETINAVDAWNGSLPGHAFYDVRQVPIRGFNIASLMPLRSTWTGLTYNPSNKMPQRSSPLLVATTHGYVPYRHHMHVQDVGHTAVFGPTGQGKTTLFGLNIASQLRFPNTRVFIFDRMRTQYVFSKAVGGNYYDFGRDRSLTLCPLQYLDTGGDRAWAANYIELLCANNAMHVTGSHREAISGAIERISHSKQRSLTHFSSACNHPDIKEALQLYTIGNALSAKLLDGESDSITDAQVTVFELKELMEMNRNIAVAVLLHLFRRIERSMDGTRLTGIYIDEARRLIQDDLFSKVMEDWLKEIRNLNGFVMLAVQELEDTNHPKLRSVIEQQCKKTIYLPNSKAASGLIRKSYVDRGLNREQIDAIVSAIPKWHYFVSEPGHFSRITLDIGKVALAFIAAQTNEERDRVDALAEQHGKEWPAFWLEEKGLPDWADRFRWILNHPD